MHFSATAFLVAISALTAGASAPTVQQFGAMKAVMRDGQTEARVALKDVVTQPHTYAVGALEGLGGEIAIIDGAVWIARVADDGLRVSGPEVVNTDQATMLTLAHVERWTGKEVQTPLAGAALESAIEHLAHEVGLDTTKPFPFIFEGELNSLDIHVMNGYCPVATDESTQAKQPWRWSLEGEVPIKATIVGFHAKDAAGVMTHHGTSIHAHAVWIVDGKMQTGHVERFVVTTGALRVPQLLE
ncbi:MAG: acetolactate decarboxylase [Phycisphaerales bacterium]|nr:acetolactate decarboxylase [Phycisphaerales bacterium]